VFAMLAAASGDPGTGARAAEQLGKDALALLKKIAFRKYAAEYRARSDALRAALGILPAGRLQAALDALDARAALRGVYPTSFSSSATSSAKVLQAASTGSGLAMSTPATRSDSMG
jgi:hypothetical protein